MARLEATVRQKEELAEGLHLIDFEQLKIENQALTEKIEERGEELLKLRRKITTTAQARRPGLVCFISIINLPPLESPLPLPSLCFASASSIHLFRTVCWAFCLCALCAPRQSGDSVEGSERGRGARADSDTHAGEAAVRAQEERAPGAGGGGP